MSRYRPRPLLVALSLASGLAACGEEPTRPVLGNVDAPASLSAMQTDALDDLAEQRAFLEPYKDYLGASSYRFFFGRFENEDAGTRDPFDLGLLVGSPPGARGIRGYEPAALIGALQTPTDRADVLVNNPAGPGLGQSEVDIASWRNVIVLAWNDAAGFSHFDDGISGWGFSTDGGATFRDGGSFPRRPTEGFRHGGDPGLAVDDNGNFFFSDLCSDGPHRNRITVSAVCVTKGRLEGGTINWSVPVFAASANNLLAFLDKCFIAVDGGGQNVYVSYTRFSAATPNGQIEVVTSRDGGLSWSVPVIVGPAEAAVNQGSEPAVGPNGEVYLTWERGWQTSVFPEILVSRSDDFGQTWSTPVIVQTIISMAFTPPPGYNRPRVNDFPRIDVARGGPNRGEVYVVYHDGARRDFDVYLSHSSNGQSWSTPVRVNSDPVGALQFWPVVAVEPNGWVDVLWYDRRLNPGTGRTDTFWGQSRDNGNTFLPNLRLSDASSDWFHTRTDIVPNYGDYNGLAALVNASHGGWGDGRRGDPDVFFSAVDFVETVASARR